MTDSWTMKPVAAQCKFDTESEWGHCSVEHHNLVQSQPENWPQYNTRLLYTREAIEQVIRECITICNDTNGASYLNGVYAGRRIKQHYGLTDETQT